MKKHTFIIGAIGIAGAVALYMLVREHSAAAAAASVPSQAGVQPQLAEAPVPQYPAPPPLPPFTVNATPYYLTFNLPPNRNLLNADSTAQQEKKDGCGCDDDCKNTSTRTTVIPMPKLLKQASSARFAMNGPNNGNMILQFPPDLYPWLYQKGGTA